MNINIYHQYHYECLQVQLTYVRSVIVKITIRYMRVSILTLYSEQIEILHT